MNGETVPDMPGWWIDGNVRGVLVGDVTRLPADAEGEDAAPPAGRRARRPPGDAGQDATLVVSPYEGEPVWSEFWGDDDDSTATEGVVARGGAAGPREGAPPSPRALPPSSPTDRRLWGWAVAIALIGVVARALYYVSFPDSWFFRLGPDGDLYLQQATTYLHGAIGGSVPSAPPGFEDVFPPGYSLLLAAIMYPFSDEAVRAQSDTLLMTIRATQWVLAGGVTLMTFALARRVIDGWATLAPPALLTISIAWVDLPSLIAYETVLAFLLTAAVLLVVKAHEENHLGPNRRLFLASAGLALGYAILVQPRVAVVAPFFAWWVVRNMSRSCLAGFAIAALLAPAGWIARNYVVYDQIVPISINGQASVYLDNVDPIGGDGFVERAAPAECPRRLLYTPRRFEWARCMQREGFALIAAHPGRAARAVPDRLAALIAPWNPTRARGTYASDHWDYHYLVPAATRRSPAFRQADRIALFIFLAAYALLAAAGIYALWMEGPRSLARLLALPLVTLPLIHLVFHAESRFRVPFTPLLMIAITLGAITLWDAFATRGRLRFRPRRRRAASPQA